mmetsp:Transcript_39066/g.99805  ORF Transcript_39066/g.99805 Transcript_39066/m.99805 type:complete len:217 (+) Transcript_39066:21-671(+)
MEKGPPAKPAMLCMRFRTPWPRAGGSGEGGVLGEARVQKGSVAEVALHDEVPDAELVDELLGDDLRNSVQRRVQLGKPGLDLVLAVLLPPGERLQALVERLRIHEGAVEATEVGGGVAGLQGSTAAIRVEVVAVQIVQGLEQVQESVRVRRVAGQVVALLRVLQDVVEAAVPAVGGVRELLLHRLVGAKLDGCPEDVEVGEQRSVREVLDGGAVGV